MFITERIPEDAEGSVFTGVDQGPVHWGAGSYSVPAPPPHQTVGLKGGNSAVVCTPGGTVF